MKAVWISSLIYTASLILLAKASTLMYSSSKAPNFSLGQIMIFGAYSSLLFIQGTGISPFFPIFPVAFITGLIIGLLECLLIIEPLIKRDRSPIFISLSTIGAGLVLQGFLHIVHDWVWLYFPSFRSYIQYRIFLREYDIEIYGISGSLLISMFTVVIDVGLLVNLILKVAVPPPSVVLPLISLTIKSLVRY